MTQDKLVSLLLNPKEIRYFSELQDIRQFLKIEEEIGSGHEDFVGVYCVIDHSNNPDEVLQSQLSEVVVALRKTDNYQRWFNNYERAAAYKRLSFYGKLKYHFIIVWRNYTRVPSAYLEHIQQKTRTFWDYAYKLKQYKERTDCTIQDLKKELRRLDNEFVVLYSQMVPKKKAKKPKKRAK